MAGIFNLFGEISAPDKGLAAKPLARSKSSLGINGTSLKNAGQSKPKGLSIRSTSTLNIPTSIQEGSSKQQEYLKPKLTQLDIGGRPISPKKELSLKKVNGCFNKAKEASPKKLLEKKNTKLSSDETMFKKPLPPKDYIKKTFPDPEKLAPYCDMHLEFDDIYTATIANEFKELLMKKSNEMMIYEDEGFESDAEQIDIEIPILCTSPISPDNERPQCRTPELPEISDDEFDP